MTIAFRLPSLVLLLAAAVSGCSRAGPSMAQPTTDAPKPSASMAAPAEPAVTQAAANEPPTGTPSVGAHLDAQCQGARDALASCAAAKTCDDNIAMFLPAASRDALLVLENKPGYSSKAFDAYCLKACQSRSDAVDEQAFARDVCAATSSAPSAASVKPTTSDASAAAQTVSSFELGKKLSVPAIEPMALTDVLDVLGPPQGKRTTPYECDSAFDEGTIQIYSYLDVELETDGRQAVGRSMTLTGGNALKLSGGGVLDAHTTREDLPRFFKSIEHGAHAERVSAQPDGSLESSYDFHFDAAGRLVKVDYWIGC